MPTPTPDWYSTHAAAFCARTFVIDMEDARARFLRHVPAGGRILDVGCGSGRDSKRFAELGYAVDARDRSREIADEAARRTGLAVRVEDVLEMDDRDVSVAASMRALVRQLLDRGGTPEGPGMSAIPPSVAPSSMER